MGRDRLIEASGFHHRQEAYKQRIHPCEIGDPHCAPCNDDEGGCCSPELITVLCLSCGGSGRTFIKRGEQR